MRILVTGAAGFIGSHLCDFLLSAGETVVGLDNFDPHYPRKVKEKNLSSAILNPHFTLAEEDITDMDAMEQLFNQHRPQGVVHLAAQVGSRQSLHNPLPYYRVNIEGTHIVFNCCRQDKIRHLVMASTSTVYQDHPAGLLSEESSEVCPKTPYAISKLANEHMGKILSKESGIPVTVLRIFSTYGPRQRPDLAIHTFFRQIYRGKPIRAFAPEGSVRDYIYIQDCVRAIYAALKTPNGYRTINVGSGQGTSLPSLLELIFEVTGMKVAINKASGLNGELRGGVAAISRARNMLSFVPQFDLKQGITEFFHWYNVQDRASGVNNV